jgi:FkbM family methyltransferase
MPATMGLRSRVAMTTIRVARRVFSGTPIETLPVTSWLRGLIFRAGFGTGQLETTIRGMSFVLPAGGDVSMVPSLVGGYHERIELDIYAQLAGVSSLVIDVGANIGLYTCVGAAAMASGKVEAFEPVPANLEFLRRNVDANGVADRCVIVEEAVSDRSGSARLYLSNGIGNHSLAAENAESDRYIDVAVTTIDERFAGRKVDVLKVDVEGFDVHVLRGALQTLRTQLPAVFVELLTGRLEHAGIAPSDLVELLVDVYDEIFVTDEPRGLVQRATRAELLKLSERKIHTNLVAVSRPEHLEIVRAYVH